MSLTNISAMVAIYTEFFPRTMPYGSRISYADASSGRSRSSLLHLPVKSSILLRRLQTTESSKVF